MPATPKPVRKAAKKFMSTLRKDKKIGKKELKKEGKLAKSKFSISKGTKYAKSVSKDLKKMTKEVKTRRKLGMQKYK